MTGTPDGSPYGVPVNYCLLDNAIYFHCAKEGRKLENLAFESRVAFCVMGEVEVLADRFSTRYESVMVSGRGEEVFAEEKQRALEALLRKYSPAHFAEGLRAIEAEGERTRVVRITIESLCGKVRR